MIEQNRILKFTIQPDKSSRQASQLHIRAALLQATNSDNLLIGNWDVLRGPFRERYCPANQTSGSGMSVALVNGDVMHENMLEAVWVPPDGYTDAVEIRGYVLDSHRTLHILKKYPISKIDRRTFFGENLLSLDECGTTKGCYLIPPNCAVQNCLYAMTWQTIEDHVTFEIMGATDGWVGVGFSKNRLMISDEYTLCVREDDNTIVHKVARVSRDNNIPDIFNIDDTLIKNNKRHRGVYKDKRIFCTFSKSKIVEDSLDFDWLAKLTDPHYVIATFGNRGDIVGHVPNIMNSENLPLVSNGRVDFNKEAFKTRYFGAGSWLVKIHMCLMLIAWVLLASIAILTSRYYRPIWNMQSRHYGKDSWLSIHQPLVITVAVLTVIAFIFMLFEINWGWPNYSNKFWHSFLGIMVVILSVMNAALVFCVPRQQGRQYCVWFWIHWLISALAHCLAIPVVFLGMDLPRLDLWDWCSWLLLAWCIFHIITDLVLEIHYCMTYRRSYERFEELEGKGRNFSQADNRYPPGYQWKPFCLGLYIVVTSAIVLTLIIAVIVYH